MPRNQKHSSGKQGKANGDGKARTPSLREEMEARLRAIEERVDEGISSLEQKVTAVLSKREFDGDARLQDEIDKALEEFERRIKSNLRELKGTDDNSQLKDLFTLLLEALEGAKEMLSLERVKGAWSKYMMSGRSEVVDDYGMDPIFEQRFKPLFDFLYYEYWRVDVRGIDHIPSDGRALLTANHSGGLPYDGGMVKLAVMNEHSRSREVRFLVENFGYHFPYLGTFLHRIGGVRACPENAIRLLEQEELVAVFPEGIKGIGKLYKNRYRLQRFGRGGFVKICLKTKSPLIPVAIVGAEEIHPMIAKAQFLAEPLGIPYIPVTPTFPWLGIFGLIPLPSKWVIKFGEPIEFSSYPDRAIENRILINKLSQHVRSTIQDMVMQLLQERRSIWFG